MAVILLLSQGVPMLLAGDEFGRTQQGNNNAWCQDNDLSWIDWTLAEKNRHQLRFFRKLIGLRRAHPIFRREDFFQTSDAAAGPEISWQGLQAGKPDWSDEGRALAFLLNGAALGDLEDDDFFVALNGSANGAGRCSPCRRRREIGSGCASSTPAAPARATSLTRSGPMR